MARYIDADKLKAHYSWWECTESGNEQKKVFDTIIDLQPTADVVEVVRCKYCAHHEDIPYTTNVWCEKVERLLPEDWFCADGERREDE